MSEYTKEISLQKSSEKPTKSPPESEDIESDEDTEKKPLTKKRSLRLQVSSEEAGSDDKVPEKKMKVVCSWKSWLFLKADLL